MLNETFSVIFKHCVHLGIALHLMSLSSAEVRKQLLFTVQQKLTHVETRGKTQDTPPSDTPTLTLM